MAFSMTTEQVRKGTKIVTRRMGWANLKPGEKFCAIEKEMGLKKGDKAVRLAILRCVSNKPEAIALLVASPKYGKEEAKKEGFPEMTGRQFAKFWIAGHRGTDETARPNRIEFEYVLFLP